MLFLQGTSPGEMQQIWRSSVSHSVRHVRCCAERPERIDSGSAVRQSQCRSAASLGAVALPRGVLWWNDKSHSVYQHDVLHGQDFVLQRTRPGGPGLVMAPQLSSLQIVDKEQRKGVSMQIYQSEHTSTTAQLAISEPFTFDITDYALIDEVRTSQFAVQQCLPYPPTSCTGIVLRDEANRQRNDEVCSGA